MTAPKDGFLLLLPGHGHLPPAPAGERTARGEQTAQERRLFPVSRPAPSPACEPGEPPPDPHSTHRSKVSAADAVPGLWPLQHPRESLRPARFPSKKCG